MVRGWPQLVRSAAEVWAVLQPDPTVSASADPIAILAVMGRPLTVRIVWPTAATITTPAHYLEVASAAMRLLAEASTTLARIRASRRL